MKNKQPIETEQEKLPEKVAETDQAPVAADVQQPAPKPLTPFRQRLAKHFAKTEAELQADELADQLACQWADEVEQQLAQYADTEGRLTQMLKEQPQLEEVITCMLTDGVPLRVAIRQTVGADNLQPQPGDDDYEAYAQQQAEADAATARLDANLKQSLAVLQQFAQEQQLDEAAQQALVDAINADFDNLLERRVTAEMLAGYRKRLNYDADVESARNEGELKGRNDNISARMAADKAAHIGDGLPQPAHGGYAPRMLKGQHPVIDFSKYQ